MPLKTAAFDYSLDSRRSPQREANLECHCQGGEPRTVRRRGGARHRLVQRSTVSCCETFSQLDWYLYPRMKQVGLRFELPYQERIKRHGAQLARRLHEIGIEWWDQQLEEYQALPVYKAFPGHLDRLRERGRARSGGVSVLGADRAQHAVRLGRQCRLAADQRSGAERRRPRRHHHQSQHRATARHRARRSGGARIRERADARPCARCARAYGPTPC